LYSETYKKLKIYASSHPDGLDTVTKNDLKTIKLEEWEVHSNESIDDNVVFSDPDHTLHF